MNKTKAPPSKRLTRGQAIRAKCLDCCCGSWLEVRECTATSCALWPYRLGHGEEQRPDAGADFTKKVDGGCSNHTANGLIENTGSSPVLSAAEAK